MKFFHLSDLHFGKYLHGYDLIEEQRRFIQDIVQAVREEQPDAIVIAGDIYDKAVPSGSAMTMLEELFLEIDSLSADRRGATELGRPIEILVIAGNHDSAPRLSYGSAFLKRHHIHIAVFPPQDDSEKLQKVTLSDSYGEVDFYLLPYVSVGMLRSLQGGDKLYTADDAVRFLLAREQIDWSRRNVLVSHQFYLQGEKEPVQCDSESPRLYVGGLDGVNTTTVEKFDYVALGHIHSPQNLGTERIRYCGTPYPYSVSEAGQKKSITVVELGVKDEICVRQIAFEQTRKVRRLQGSMEEIAGLVKNGGSFDRNNCSANSGCDNREDMNGKNGYADRDVCDDYVSIILTDEEPLEAPKDYLEHYYHNILEIKIDNVRSRQMFEEEISDMQEMTPFEAFGAFFEDTAGRKMTEREQEVLQEILEEI